MTEPSRDAELAAARDALGKLRTKSLALIDNGGLMLPELVLGIVVPALSIPNPSADALLEDKKRLAEATVLLRSVHTWFMQQAPQHYNGCGLWIDVDGFLSDAARKQQEEQK